MINSKNYRLFNLLFLPLVGLNLAFIAIFNLAVDPYGVIKNLTAPEQNQFDFAEDSPPPVTTPEPKKVENKNQPKPTTLEQRNKYRAERFKINLATLSITKIQPKAIFLGTSTALKLSTEHPALKKVQPVYNLALPGAKMRDIKSYFDDTLANHPDLQEVVLSLDFFAFGGQKKPVKSTPEPQPEKPQEVTVVRTNKYSVTIPELVKINFSLDTFIASLKKVTASDVPLLHPAEQPKSEKEKKSKVLGARIDRKSSTKLKSKSRKKVTRKSKEAAKASKRQKTQKPKPKETKKPNKKVEKNVKNPVNRAQVVKPDPDKQKKKTSVTKPTVKPAKVEATLYKDSARYSNFQRVMKMYLAEKTLYKDYNLSEEELAAFQAIVDTCKKRNIKLKVFIAPVHAAQLELINRAGIWSEFENWKREIVKITPVWDFASYSNLTTEPIGDRMNHFVDSVHYRDQVADLIMQRIYNYQPEKVPANFGKLISPKNIEPHLKVVREQRLNWKDDNLQIVQFVMEMQKENAQKK
ncbi:hypothetical protein ACE1B6_14300 [Aerosakkonemataceae cyanobacterium BLCC-F154]|uniref:Uncharacterized protein n=1 Tax=Floridaenema fluviatile BLCC-F154 TaxID=3153640 RepID=A0ABV4YEA0_9CYAN